MPTMPAILNPEPKTVPGKVMIPEALRSRQLMLNIVCYLNVLFLLIYFPITV